MSHFELLHPALQHHIVNSLGWKELRPFQDAALPHVLRGEHAIILAPTAGGKTESALFPVLSRMLTESWTGLSVLYICPIRALINDLNIRLERYLDLVGRRVGHWHGDVQTGARTKMLRDNPDLLLTTPESLEGMLTSTRVDSRELFSNLKVVIVDEVHAFAGDDRGWHLLSVLSRIQRLSNLEFQRVGLSATVGNPEDLLEWLVSGGSAPRRVLYPPPSVQTHADVQLDYVGSLENAASVISRLHRGEKRLVFVDSRARAEKIASALASTGTKTFITHSSLSPEHRRDAEASFLAGQDCVIVATSVLELGVDIGDLDRVIQIDSPSSVASFMQRMGRTGRRQGTRRNCLFLTTNEDALMQAASIIALFEEGYVEQVNPPTAPYHILAQQLMALALQERGIGITDWFEWVKSVPAFSQTPLNVRSQILEWMLEKDILTEDGGVLWFGRHGEQSFGRKNFRDLLSVFTSAPVFLATHGKQELGYIDERTLYTGGTDGLSSLLLAGQIWSIVSIDWKSRRVYVQPATDAGTSPWRGQPVLLSFDLCQALKRIYQFQDESNCWSRRACERIQNIRDSMPYLTVGRGTCLVRSMSGLVWWTFAGGRANQMIGAFLAEKISSPVSSDSFAIHIAAPMEQASLLSFIDRLKPEEILQHSMDFPDKVMAGLKFSDALPTALGRFVLNARLTDVSAVEKTLDAQMHITDMA